MNVNLKGAASNAFTGIRALLDFIKNESGDYDDVESFVEEINEIIVKYQPQAAAWVVNECLSDPNKILLPKTLTAENGAKALLMGEFYETREIECPKCLPECLGVFDFEQDESCGTCHGVGNVSEQIPVSWTTIKAIYDKVVEHYG